MITSIKSLAKEMVLSIPFLREKYFQREFLRRAPSCRGIYKTFEQATADSPRERLVGCNHQVMPEYYKKNVDTLNPHDYPVLFWLSRLLPDAQLVFELGGSIGMGYYAYRRYLPFPARLEWIICELPATIQAGQKIALERNELQLKFSDQRQAPGDPDIYATFGTLQYIEEPFAEIIRDLRVRPPNILVSRVPLCDGACYITLQNNGAWLSPYKVDNKLDFINSIKSLGYELVDSWEINPHVSFLIPPEYDIPHYHGMYFRLK